MVDFCKESGLGGNQRKSSSSVPRGQTFDILKSLAGIRVTNFVFNGRMSVTPYTRIAIVSSHLILPLSTRGITEVQPAQQLAVRLEKRFLGPRSSFLET